MNLDRLHARLINYLKHVLLQGVLIKNLRSLQGHKLMQHSTIHYEVRILILYPIWSFSNNALNSLLSCGSELRHTSKVLSQHLISLSCL